LGRGLGVGVCTLSGVVGSEIGSDGFTDGFLAFLFCFLIFWSMNFSRSNTFENLMSGVFEAVM
jgi:hypothetical protein